MYVIRNIVLCICCLMSSNVYCNNQKYVQDLKGEILNKQILDYFISSKAEDEILPGDLMELYGRDKDYFMKQEVGAEDVLESFTYYGVWFNVYKIEASVSNHSYFLVTAQIPEVRALYLFTDKQQYLDKYFIEDKCNMEMFNINHQKFIKLSSRREGIGYYRETVSYLTINNNTIIESFKTDTVKLDSSTGKDLRYLNDIEFIDLNNDNLLDIQVTEQVDIFDLKASKDKDIKDFIVKQKLSYKQVHYIWHTKMNRFLKRDARKAPVKTGMR